MIQKIREKQDNVDPEQEPDSDTDEECEIDPELITLTEYNEYEEDDPTEIEF